MTEFEALLQDYVQAFEALLTVASQYPVDIQNQEGVCGKWSAREVLAHLSGWIVEAIRRYPRYTIGTADINYNTDAFNEVSVRLRRDKDYQQVIDELRTVSQDLAELARHVSLVQQEKDKRYAEWLFNLAREAREHQAQLQAFLEKLN